MSTSSFQGQRGKDATSYRFIVYEEGRDVAKIRLNRPPVNALSWEMRRELKQAIEKAHQSGRVRAIVLIGSEKMFSAGADVKEAQRFSRGEWVKYVLLSRELLRTIGEVDEPVIAVVRGPALGGGFDIVLSCDLAIASENAIFGFPEIKLDLMVGGGGNVRLPLHVGLKKAKELILTGKTITSKEAERLGVINKVVPDSELEAEVNKLVEELVSKQRTAVSFAKRAINLSVKYDYERALQRDLELFLQYPYELFLRKAKVLFEKAS
jgi:enoyl-CoA hydratase